MNMRSIAAMLCLFTAARGVAAGSSPAFLVHGTVLLPSRVSAASIRVSLHAGNATLASRDFSRASNSSLYQLTFELGLLYPEAPAAATAAASSAVAAALPACASPHARTLTALASVLTPSGILYVAAAPVAVCADAPSTQRRDWRKLAQQPPPPLRSPPSLLGLSSSIVGSRSVSFVLSALTPSVDVDAARAAARAALVVGVGTDSLTTSSLLLRRWLTPRPPAGQCQLGDQLLHAPAYNGNSAFAVCSTNRSLPPGSGYEFAAGIASLPHALAVSTVRNVRPMLPLLPVIIIVASGILRWLAQGAAGQRSIAPVPPTAISASHLQSRRERVLALRNMLMGLRATAAAYQQVPEAALAAVGGQQTASSAASPLPLLPPEVLQRQQKQQELGARAAQLYKRIHDRLEARQLLPLLRLPTGF